MPTALPTTSTSDWETIEKPSHPSPTATTPPSSLPAGPSSTSSAISTSQPSSSKPTPTLLVLSSTDVAQTLSSLSLESILASQASAFASFSSARAPSPSSSSSISASTVLQAPPRLSLSLPHHTTLIMPSRSDDGTACKIVSVPKEDSAEGIPGANVVLNQESGRLEAVIASGELTGVRTAAGSAVASRLLLGEGKERKKLVTFGTGVQAFWHIHLHLQLFPSIDHICLISRPCDAPSARTTSLVARLSDLHPKIAISHSSVPDFNRDQAVHNADIIICCTPSTIPLFSPTTPRRGTHIVLVGSYKPTMFEIEPEMLSRGGLVFVDGTEACTREAGEFQNYSGQLAEVGSFCGNGADEGAAKKAWEEAGGDLTIFKSVGLAPQDVAISKLILTKARELGLGDSVPF